MTVARVTVTERALDDETREAVLALADAAERADEVAPLSEQVLLDVRRPGDRRVAHVLLDDDGLVGYAHLDLSAASEPSAPRTGELVVHPEARRRGLGSVLLAGLRGLTGTAEGGGGDATPPVSVWAHGDLPPARAFAESRGLRRTRELHVFGLDLDPIRESGAELPTPPQGVDVRTFRPGTDEEAWVALNAAAFADHPEQGRMSVADLRDREQEPWFDAERLWLVTEAGGGAAEASEPLASLWLKQEPGEDVVELYVLGVHPSAQGRGLGGWLTRHALADAARSGARRMILYVDGDNHAAVRTYRSAGFDVDLTDAQYTG